MNTPIVSGAKRPVVVLALLLVLCALCGTATAALTIPSELIGEWTILSEFVDGQIKALPQKKHFCSIDQNGVTLAEGGKQALIGVDKAKGNDGEDVTLFAFESGKIWQFPAIDGRDNLKIRVLIESKAATHEMLHRYLVEQSPLSSSAEPQGALPNSISDDEKSQPVAEPKVEAPKKGVLLINGMPMQSYSKTEETSGVSQETQGKAAPTSKDPVIAMVDKIHDVLGEPKTVLMLGDGSKWMYGKDYIFLKNGKLIKGSPVLMKKLSSAGIEAGR